MQDPQQEAFNREASADDLKKAKEKFWDKMKQFAGKVPFAKDAAALYYFVRDPAISLGVKSAAVLALLYFISPIDVVPDTIPIAGLVDDAGVIAAVMQLLGGKLKPYKEMAESWFKRGQKPSDEPENEVEV